MLILLTKILIFFKSNFNYFRMLKTVLQFSAKMTNFEPKYASNLLNLYYFTFIAWRLMTF